MEGPYFSYKKRGAQNPDYLKEPDFEGFRKLYEDCGGLVRIVDIAPELPGAAVIVFLSGGCNLLKSKMEGRNWKKKKRII